MNGITVCVDFSDLLTITLTRNRHHFDRFAVVTSLQDDKTLEVAGPLDCEILRTGVFTANGAYFNKWAALEEGLAAFCPAPSTRGRSQEGWLAILDCDVVWPRNIDNWLKTIEPGNLYTPRRRMLEDLTLVHQHGLPYECTWGKLPLHRGIEFAGYSQIFSLSDPVLEKKPWFGSWMSAGTGDSFFQSRWPDSRKIRPPWEVLHLGHAGRNWCGRVEPLMDGSPVAECGRRNIWLQEMLRRRSENPSDRFRHERLG